MTLGVVMLAHTALERAGQVALHLAQGGATVAIHVDASTPDHEYHALVQQIATDRRVHLARRRHCDWGTWSLVQATRDTARHLLSVAPDIRHVALISGACLPLKSVRDLQDHLTAHPDTDFIESVTIDEVPWAKDGLGKERFAFTFPFPWKRRKRLFDRWVALQRRLGRERSAPNGLKLHMGSQWWCLTRQTLEAILADTQYDDYFRRVWIPDESFFATLARKHARHIESQSLTLSRFDFRGNPHIFYDDHLDLLRDHPAFFARKVWPGARRLYGSFLGTPLPSSTPVGLPRTGEIETRIAEAVARRTKGRAGLVMAGRFPRAGFENGVTAYPYVVFHGFGDVFRNFQAWPAKTLSFRAHGHLFSPERVEFAEGSDGFVGGLSDSATLRDYNPAAFLRNLIWNTRGEHQAFLHGPADTGDLEGFLATDANAYVFAITGAWSIPLLATGQSVSALRAEAARLQAREAAWVDRLQQRNSLAHLRVWTLGEVLQNPSEPLASIIDDLAIAGTRTLAHVPKLQPTNGLAAFLQSLRNCGMNPYTAGDVLKDHQTRVSDVSAL